MPNSTEIRHDKVAKARAALAAGTFRSDRIFTPARRAIHATAEAVRIDQQHAERREQEVERFDDLR